MNKNGGTVEWNGYKIMQNEMFMRLYCKHKNLEFLKIDGTIVYLHRIPAFGYTLMKIHSPDLKDLSAIIQRSQVICKERNVAVLEILTPYRDGTIERYVTKPDGTIIINLSNNEDILWKNLNKKTRNEIRQGERNGVVIERVKDEKDFNSWWEIYKHTLSTKKFSGQPYSLVYETFKNPGISSLFVAKVGGKIAAGAFLLLDEAPLYWLGATDLSFAKYRPNNLLHWEIIKWAKKQGYNYYDMGGAVIDKKHGPTKFKEGFGGEYKNFNRYEFPVKFIKHIIVKTTLQLYEWRRR